MKLGQNNSKATNALLHGLSETIFTKFAHCKSAKEIWDKLRNILKEIQQSKKQSFKLTKVSSNN